MIIFLILFIFIFLILIAKFRIFLYLKIENTDILLKIKFIFFETNKKGKLAAKKKSVSQKAKSSRKKRPDLNFIMAVIKNLYFEKLVINEKIGLYEIIPTAFSVPILASITCLPLQFLKIDYNNLKYEIIPLYNEFKFEFCIDSIISFRIINVILSIINEKLSKLFLRIRGR